MDCDNNSRHDFRMRKRGLLERFTVSRPDQRRLYLKHSQAENTIWKPQGTITGTSFQRGSFARPVIYASRVCLRHANCMRREKFWSKLVFIQQS